MSDHTSKKSAFSSPKVVVVGGGIAGLTTAYRLLSAGINVELYEARGRVGGRILTVTINGHIAELGGQNINDGGEAANLNGLIDACGLLRTSSRVNSKQSYFNGKALISMRELLKGKTIDPELLGKHLQHLAFTCGSIQEILDEVVETRDLYNFLAVRMAAYEGGPIDKLSPIYFETLFRMFLSVFYSAKAGEEKDIYLDRVTIAGGNAVLPQKIQEALGPRLHLNMPLTKVAKNKNDVFHLTFQNGKQIEANIVVLTMPCSVYEQIIFENDVIPAQKLEAMRNIPYGRNAKIIVPLTSLSPKNTGMVVADETISSFDCAQQLLTVYCTGNASLFHPETLPGTYTQVKPMIETCFINDRLPTTIPAYAIDQNNRAYNCPVGYSWSNDPYAGGSYAYIANGQEHLLTATMEQNGEMFKALFAPLDQRLYFAGEHTSILSDVPGTMEAACESGERIARTICKSMSIPQGDTHTQ